MRPLLARAYRHVEQITLSNRSIPGHEAPHVRTRVSALLLDAQDCPVKFEGEAQKWMNQFFPGPRSSSSRLPKTIANWLRYGHDSKLPRSPSDSNDVLVRERKGLRLIPGLKESERILVFGLQTIADAKKGGITEQLTHREIQVLLEVEQGRSNDEIGAALSISPLTVRTHLEHIYHKLHVPCRIAAASQFRRLYSTLGSGFCWLISFLNDSSPAIQIGLG